jgi:hypothetical protein
VKKGGIIFLSGIPCRVHLYWYAINPADHAMNNISKALFVLVSSAGLSGLATAQSGSPDMKTISAPFNAQRKPKVMILGTFHFNDGGHDQYKPKYAVNIKSGKRQQEIKQLLEILARYRPTKVAIESMPQRQRFHDSLYKEFIWKQYEPGENEIYQVCYRLAGMMGHPGVYCIDAPPRRYESINADSFAVVHHQEHYFDSVYGKLFMSLYAKDDSLISVLPLKASLAYENNPERLRLGLGHYLIGGIKIAADGQYPGADDATSWWNRNLRIFSGILRLAAASKEERIFLMIGSGHLQILRFLAMACPEIEFVDVYDYLK